MYVHILWEAVEFSNVHNSDKNSNAAQSILFV